MGVWKKPEVWQLTAVRGSGTRLTLRHARDRKCGGLHAKDACAPTMSANQEESTHRTASGSHGSLRTGPEGAPEAERRRRARREQAEEEKEGQRQGETSGSDGNKQKERRGEAALPGQADAGPGGLREDAGEAANGEDPEESIQNPQAESGGLQQAPGHPHRALRHPQSQLDQVAPWPGCGGASRESRRRSQGPVWLLGIFWKHYFVPMPLLLSQYFSKLCSLSLELD